MLEIEKLGGTMKLLFLLFVISTNVFAFETDIPFKVEGSMTHFYGGKLSAEADMWSKALSTCDDLGQITNKISDTKFKNHDDRSIATATFVCKRQGTAN
jgi:hypothetical protein